MAQDIFFSKEWEKILVSFNSINLFWRYQEEIEREIEDRMITPICVSYPSMDARSGRGNSRQYNSNQNYEFFE